MLLKVEMEHQMASHPSYPLDETVLLLTLSLPDLIYIKCHFETRKVKIIEAVTILFWVRGEYFIGNNTNCFRAVRPWLCFISDIDT